MSLPIGGFMPIPLAMMIPFMAVQSMVMGDAFGRSFQYGKRKISAMTNEEFNATTLPKMAEEIFTDYKQIIPKLGNAITESTELQKMIVNEMLMLIPKLTAGVVTAIGENIGNIPKVKETIEGATPSADTIGTRTPSRPTTAISQTQANNKLQIESQYSIVVRRQQQTIAHKKSISIWETKLSQEKVNSISYTSILKTISKLKSSINSNNITNQVQLKQILALQQSYKAKYGVWIALV